MADQEGRRGHVVVIGSVGPTIPSHLISPASIIAYHSIAFLHKRLNGFESFLRVRLLVGVMADTLHSAGVTGLTSALFLAEAGYTVTVLAAHVPGDESIEYTSPW
jgi:hypothetical protein